MNGVAVLEKLFDSSVTVLNTLNCKFQLFGSVFGGITFNNSVVHDSKQLRKLAASVSEMSANICSLIVDKSRLVEDAVRNGTKAILDQLELNRLEMPVRGVYAETKLLTTRLGDDIQDNHLAYERIVDSILNLERRLAELEEIQSNVRDWRKAFLACRIAGRISLITGLLYLNETATATQLDQDVGKDMRSIQAILLDEIASRYFNSEMKNRTWPWKKVSIYLSLDGAGDLITFRNTVKAVPVDYYSHEVQDLELLHGSIARAISSDARELSEVIRRINDRPFLDELARLERERNRLRITVIAALESRINALKKKARQGRQRTLGSHSGRGSVGERGNVNTAALDKIARRFFQAKMPQFPWERITPKLLSASNSQELKSLCEDLESLQLPEDVTQINDLHRKLARAVSALPADEVRNLIPQIAHRGFLNKLVRVEKALASRRPRLIEEIQERIRTLEHPTVQV